jgi:hypothetical protein
MSLSFSFLLASPVHAAESGARLSEHNLPAQMNATTRRKIGKKSFLDFEEANARDRASATIISVRHREKREISPNSPQGSAVMSTKAARS